MATLLLRLAAQRQAYDTTAEFSKRRTELAPTKSAVIGMIAAALGKPQLENNVSPTFADLCALKMGVRIDRAGKIEEQFSTGGRGKDVVYNRHTGKVLNVRDFGLVCAGNDSPISPQINGKENNPSKLFGSPWTGYIIRRKSYLVDAAFTVGLEGSDDLLKKIAYAFQSPKWIVYLGRKACPPHFPIILENAILFDQDLSQALSEATSIVDIQNDWLSEVVGPVFDRYLRQKREAAKRVRCILECLPADEDAKMVRDVPTEKGLGIRPYDFRFVRDVWVTLDKKGNENVPHAHQAV